jgi:hypothetical protein
MFLRAMMLLFVAADSAIGGYDVHEVLRDNEVVIWVEQYLIILLC